MIDLVMCDRNGVEIKLPILSKAVIYCTMWVLNIREIPTVGQGDYAFRHS